jgi:hypothetical protein
MYRSITLNKIFSQSTLHLPFHVPERPDQEVVPDVEIDLSQTQRFKKEKDNNQTTVSHELDIGEPGHVQSET